MDYLIGIGIGLVVFCPILWFTLKSKQHKIFATARAKSDEEVAQAQRDVETLKGKATSEIREQRNGAREEFRMGQRRPPAIARRVREVEPIGLSGDEFRRAAHQLADAQLGPLQIGEDADRTAEFRPQPADRLDPGRMLVVGAVAEVEPEDIRARLEQGADHFGRIARRPQRSHDLRVAMAAHSPGL